MGGSQTKVFKPIIEATFKSAHSVLVQHGSNAADVKRFVDEEQAKLEKSVEAHVEKVFKEFDKDKSGELDAKEAEELILASLKAQREFVPQMTVELTKNMMKSALDEAEAKGCGAQVRSKVEEILQAQERKIQESLDELITDYKTIAEKMFAAMDGDKNGRVSRTEFIDNYMRAAKVVIDENPHA